MAAAAAAGQKRKHGPAFPSSIVTNVPDVSADSSSSPSSPRVSRMCSGEDRASKKSNYNSAIQRWFKKKQLPLWTHCVRHWQEETREAQLPDIVALAFRNWQADYAFATRRMARREQRAKLVESYMTLVEAVYRTELPTMALAPGLYTAEALPTRADIASTGTTRRCRRILPKHMHIHFVLDTLRHEALLLPGTFPDFDQPGDQVPSLEGVVPVYIRPPQRSRTPTPVPTPLSLHSSAPLSSEGSSLCPSHDEEAGFGSEVESCYVRHTVSTNTPLVVPRMYVPSSPQHTVVPFVDHCLAGARPELPQQVVLISDDANVQLPVPISSPLPPEEQHDESRVVHAMFADMPRSGSFSRDCTYATAALYPVFPLALPVESVGSVHV